MPKKAFPLDKYLLLEQCRGVSEKVTDILFDSIRVVLVVSANLTTEEIAGMKELWLALVAEDHATKLALPSRKEPLELSTYLLSKKTTALAKEWAQISTPERKLLFNLVLTNDEIDGL